MTILYSTLNAQTVAAIESFFLGLTRHRAYAQKAQAEIDAVIGNDQLPSMADRDRLPYCEALYLEVMRMYTLMPSGKRSCYVHRVLGPDRC